MPPLYVSQPGAQVRTRGGRLQVTCLGRILADLPLEEVDQLAVLGRGVQVSTPAIVALVSRGVEVCYLSRGGRFFGKVIGAPNGASGLRIAQSLAASDPERALLIAQAVVGAKLTNQVGLLRALGAERGADQVERRLIDVAATGSVDQLRGVEGAAAAAYFRALGPLFPPALGFRTRAHHPPPDPVNAALSFGYTLLLNEAIGRINLVGLDPYVGFLHVQEPGRPSFALDVEEELRPVVDELVLRLGRTGGLTAADFMRHGGGVRMTAEARKRYLGAYEAQLARRVTHPLAHGRVELRLALELQVRQIGRLIGGGQDWLEPLRLDELWAAP